MKTNLYLSTILLGLTLTVFTGCKKDLKTATLNIKVLDPNNRSAGNIKFDILQHQGEFFQTLSTIVSSSNGETLINLRKDKIYYIYLVPQERYTDWYMGNSAAQLFNVGLFQSLDEINNLPIHKPTPKIGDVKYADINGDAIISVEDLVLKVDLEEDILMTVNLVAGKMRLHR
ncbi:hypothetical protein [Pedobacter glucosidilyticus]|uniref:hypothetical protein n=1 Tax=Pedobacter glucosidilyticus TaxID=1122941 RepID=UPI00041684BA|nr:hypothetical protein [Pedobacter glucosidilyticus]